MYVMQAWSVSLLLTPTVTQVAPRWGGLLMTALASMGGYGCLHCFAPFPAVALQLSDMASLQGVGHLCYLLVFYLGETSLRLLKWNSIRCYGIAERAIHIEA